MSRDIRSDPAVKTWLEGYANQRSHDPMVSNLRGFMGFLDEMKQFKDITPSGLIEYHKRMKKRGEESEYEVWRLLQKYSNSKKGTAKTKRLRVSHVRSFFSENFAELPSKEMRIYADKDPVKSLLDELIIKDLIDNSEFDMKAFYLTLFMGFMGIGEFLQFNEKYAKMLTDHLKTKGVDEPLLIEFPGRKSTKGKSWFYTFIGHDALVAWKNYFERQRGDYPKDGEAILLNQHGKPIKEFALRQRHMRRLEKLQIIERGKSKDVRHGYGMHNTRDAAKSHIHRTCKNIIVETKPEVKKFDDMCVEFWMGHTVDRYGYDQFYKDKEYMTKHYKIAEKYLNLVSGESPDTKLRQELESLKSQDKSIRKFVDDSLQEKTDGMKELSDRIISFESLFKPPSGSVTREKSKERVDLLKSILGLSDKAAREMTRKGRKCRYCKEENGPLALFCHKCGKGLILETTSEQDLMDNIMKMVREAK